MFAVLISVPYPQQGTTGQVRGVTAVCDSAVLFALCTKPEPVTGLDSPARCIVVADTGGRRRNGGCPGSRRVGDTFVLCIVVRADGGEKRCCGLTDLHITQYWTLKETSRFHLDSCRLFNEGRLKIILSLLSTPNKHFFFLL